MLRAIFKAYTLYLPSILPSFPYENHAVGPRIWFTTSKSWCSSGISTLPSFRASVDRGARDKRNDCQTTSQKSENTPWSRPSKLRYIRTQYACQSPSVLTFCLTYPCFSFRVGMLSNKWVSLISRNVTLTTLYQRSFRSSMDWIFCGIEQGFKIRWNMSRVCVSMLIEPY